MDLSYDLTEIQTSDMIKFLNICTRN